jgi:NADPH:quinone reductase
MKIVRFHETGPADVLRIEDVPMESPKAGEVRLKVYALGLNRAEVAFRRGQYPEAPVLPARLGYEAAGIVDAVGPDVTGFKVGDKVSTIPGFSQNLHGVYGEYAVVPVNYVASHPDNLTFREAASIWMQYMTAYGALIDIGKLQSGEFVLITAASSSVGLAAIQLARNAGAIVIATTRGDIKKQMIMDAGAQHVIVTDQEQVAERVMSITDGKGARVVFDPIVGRQLRHANHACDDVCLLPHTYLPLSIIVSTVLYSDVLQSTSLHMVYLISAVELHVAGIHPSYSALVYSSLLQL